MSRISGNNNLTRKCFSYLAIEPPWQLKTKMCNGRSSRSSNRSIPYRITSGSKRFKGMTYRRLSYRLFCTIHSWWWVIYHLSSIGKRTKILQSFLILAKVKTRRKHMCMIFSNLILLIKMLFRLKIRNLLPLSLAALGNSKHHHRKLVENQIIYQRRLKYHPYRVKIVGQHSRLKNRASSLTSQHLCLK